MSSTGKFINGILRSDGRLKVQQQRRVHILPSLSMRKPSLMQTIAFVAFCLGTATPGPSRPLPRPLPAAPGPSLLLLAAPGRFRPLPAAPGRPRPLPAAAASSRTASASPRTDGAPSRTAPAPH